jgi:DNA-binding transcriptional LysR family regulator
MGWTRKSAWLRGGLEGALRLGVIPTALPPTTLITTRFRESHPRMRFELRSMTSREIADGLSTGELDAGLTYLDNEVGRYRHFKVREREAVRAAVKRGEPIGRRPLANETINKTQTAICECYLASRESNRPGA